MLVFVFVVVDGFGVVVAVCFVLVVSGVLVPIVPVIATKSRCLHEDSFLVPDHCGSC